MTKRGFLILAASIACFSGGCAIAIAAGYMMGIEHRPQQPTYLSSMVLYEPVNGLIHIECNTGDPKKKQSLDARALGITFDKDGKIDILVEPNNSDPDNYSRDSFWLKNAGLCQAYVR